MKGALAIALLAIVLVAGPVWGSHLFTDSFPQGRPQLRWSFFPFFNLDNLQGRADPSAPDGDGGIGVLTNSRVGGFASLSYAVTTPMQNFHLEALLYCPRTEGTRGPLAGLAFLIDPIEGDFYRLVCDFKTADANLNLAFVGRSTRNYPVYLKFWGPEEIPGGATEGWHRVLIRVQLGRATLYWDGVELPGGPFLVDRVRRGFAGVYANFVGGLGAAEARIDGFLLRRLEEEELQAFK